MLPIQKLFVLIFCFIVMVKCSVRTNNEKVNGTKVTKKQEGEKNFNYYDRQSQQIKNFVWRPKRIRNSGKRETINGIIMEYGVKPNCKKEVATKTLITQPFQNIRGNGSSIHITIIDDCCPGYKRYEYNHDICIPDCENNCKNGICVSPGLCKCFPGYVRNLSKDCVHTCPAGCLNGKCHPNGSCICNEGYKLKKNQKYCVPVCEKDCDLRNCSAPNLCSCLNSFEENANGVCIPKCENDCLHGICIVPDTCVCYPGYNLKNGICQANCTQKCINGRCVSNNVCDCDFGYQYDPFSTICVPSCYNCQNGICIAPENCKCFEEYEQFMGTCRPICKKNCGKGQCIAPDICYCDGLTGGDYDECSGKKHYCNVSIYGYCLW